jgi:hypothetical protein
MTGTDEAWRAEKSAGLLAQLAFAVAAHRHIEDPDARRAVATGLFPALGYALRLASASEDDPGFAAHARLEAIWENPDLIAEVLFDLGHDNRVTKGGVVAAASRFIEDQRIFAATRRPPSVEAIAAKVESIKASLSKPMPLPPADAEPPPRPHNETDREETTP